MTIRGGVHCFLLLLVASSVSAYTLEEAIHAALVQRGDVTAAENDLESSRWSRNAAHAWFLPQVNFTLAYQRNHDVQQLTIPEVGSFPMGTEWGSSYGVSATLPLTFQGLAAASMSTEALKFAELSLAATRQDAASEVINLFYGVLLADMVNNVATEAIGIAREGYRLSEIKFQSGTISRFELLQSQVAYENRKPDSIAAEVGLHNARSAFAVSVGLQENYPVILEGDLQDSFPIEIPSTLEEARGLMRASSIELAISREMRELGDAGVVLAAAQFAPQLVLKTDYSFQAGVGSISDFVDERYSRNWVTSAALQIPIFNGINDFSGYRSSRYERLASYANAEDIESYASLGLITAWNELERARQTVETVKLTVQLAEDAFGIAFVSYESGVITRIEMDMSILALTQARTHFASALFSLKSSEAGLLRALGKLDFPVT